jgi:hypothetical protein
MPVGGGPDDFREDKRERTHRERAVERRNFYRRLSDQEVHDEVMRLGEQVDTIETELKALNSLPEQQYEQNEAISAIRGALETLTAIVTARFNQIQPKVEEAAGIKTTIQYMALVLVPILVALLGGYFATR